MTVVTYRETLSFLPERSVSLSAPCPETVVCQTVRSVPTTSVYDSGAIVKQPAGLAVK